MRDDDVLVRVCDLAFVPVRRRGGSGYLIQGVGEMIGRKLAVIAKERQVFCITHLPQIASYGNVHLLIKKNVQGEETTIECLELAKRGRIDELARMLSGDVISQLSLKHAEDLLHQADRFKETI